MQHCGRRTECGSDRQWGKVSFSSGIAGHKDSRGGGGLGSGQRHVRQWNRKVVRQWNRKVVRQWSSKMVRQWNSKVVRHWSTKMVRPWSSKVVRQ